MEITMEQYNDLIARYVRPMSPVIKAQWLQALGSGEFKQGTQRLAFTPSGQDVTRYCCLGVLCELAIRGGVPIVSRPIESQVYIDNEKIVGLATMYAASTATLGWEVVEWAKTGSDNPYIAVDRDGGPIPLAGLNDSGFTFEQIADMIEVFL